MVPFKNGKLTAILTLSPLEWERATTITIAIVGRATTLKKVNETIILHGDHWKNIYSCQKPYINIYFLGLIIVHLIFFKQVGLASGS